MHNVVAAIQADLQSAGEDCCLESLAAVDERRQAMEERCQHRDELSEINRRKVEMEHRLGASDEM